MPLVVFTLVTSKSPILGGIRSFVVLTGSMSPNIPQGSLVFTQKQPIYQKGDVVTFTHSGSTVTHRVAEVVDKNNLKLFKTKGDANNVEDQDLVPQTSIIGKEVLFVPVVGNLILLLRTLPGFILLIILPTCLFIGLEAKFIKKELEKEIEKKLMKKMETTKNA